MIDTVKEIITMTAMTGSCDMSSPSSRFFIARSKFPYVPLSRPSLFMEDDPRTRGCHSTIKAAKKSFIMVIFHPRVSDLPSNLSSRITHSAVNTIQAVRQPHTMGSLVDNGVASHKY